MTKLTPAKHLKLLEKTGWIDFVHFMIQQGVMTPRQIVEGKASNKLELYRQVKTAMYLAEDLEFSLYHSPVGEAPRMMGLSEQVTPKSKKMVGRFNAKRN